MQIIINIQCLHQNYIVANSQSGAAAVASWRHQSDREETPSRPTHDRLPRLRRYLAASTLDVRCSSRVPGLLHVHVNGGQSHYSLYLVGLLRRLSFGFLIAQLLLNTSYHGRVRATEAQVDPVLCFLHCSLFADSAGWYDKKVVDPICAITDCVA